MESRYTARYRGFDSHRLRQNFDMTHPEELDPRELAALRMEAETALISRTQQLADMLIAQRFVAEEQRNQLSDYLDKFDPELLELINSKDLQGRFALSLDLPALKDERYVSLETQVMGQSLEQDSRFKQRLFLDPVLLKDRIVSLRTLSLIQRQMGVDPQDQLARNFAARLAEEYVDFDLPIPNNIESVVSPEDLAAIRERAEYFDNLPEPEQDRLLREGMEKLGSQLRPLTFEDHIHDLETDEEVRGILGRIPSLIPDIRKFAALVLNEEKTPK